MKWLAPHFGPGEISAADFIAQRVADILRADTKLAAIFGVEGIVVCGVYMPDKPVKLPQLVVTPGLADGEPLPSLVSEAVTIYLVARFVLSHVEMMRPDEPGLSTLWNHIILTLQASGAKHLNYRRDNGTVVQLVSRSVPQTVRTEPEPEATIEYAVRSILPWEYEVRLDPETRRIRNLTT